MARQRFLAVSRRNGSQSRHSDSGTGRVVAFTSLIGIAVPFSVGLVLGLKLPEAYLVAPERRLLFSLFIGTALSISAIPLVAKILMDLSLLRTNVGQTILGSAIVNDLVGWVLFAVILSTLNIAVQGHGSVLGIVILTVAFRGLSYDRQETGLEPV